MRSKVHLPQDTLNWKFGELRTKLLAQAMCGQLVALPSPSSLATNYDLASPTVADEPLALPPHWQRVALKQISTIIAGHTPASNAKYWEPPTINWITPADLRQSQTPYITNSERKISPCGLNNSRCNLVPQDSVIYSTRATIGLVALTAQPSCTNQGCMALIPKRNLIEPKWLYYALQFVTPALKKQGKGSIFQEVAKSKFSACLIPLPPLAEQRSICTVLDALMEQVERMEQAYQELSGPIAIQLEQKLLELATRGQLLPQIELNAANTPTAAHVTSAISSATSNSLRPVTREKEPDALPPTWHWLRLGQLTTKITRGVYNIPHNVGPEHGFPLLAIADISSSGQLNFSAVKRWVATESWRDENKRAPIAPNDVILAATGLSGKVALVETERPFIVTHSLALIKPRPNLIVPKFLFYVLRAPAFQKWLQSNRNGTGIKHVAMSKLERVLIPVPPLSEQQHIVACLDELLPWLTRVPALDDLLKS
ncbi:MAG TPA: restriction endonuclease subunit S [Candidatus Anaerobiospirillum stercoravium]|nr:restriction endonuclease subunit S [Candidatus Anaerobiospirillum stercoravium]